MVISRNSQFRVPSWHRNSLSQIGLGLLLSFVLVGLLAPVLAPPLNPRQPYLLPRDGFHPTPRPPGASWQTQPPPLPFWGRLMPGGRWVHLLGTTSGQWDIYYGVVWGTRTALQVGLIVESSTLVIGLLVGSLAALRGGWVDEGLMRLTDLFLAFPGLLAALALTSSLTPLLGKSIWPALLALIAFGWMGYARLMRGELLALQRREFILAAHLIGASQLRILVRHLAPSALTPTLIVAALNIGNDVLAFAGLSFLGIGPEPGYADWGQLLSFARQWVPTLATFWWVVVWPGLALTLFSLGWNLAGDTLRDAVDPRLRGR
jgi:peptide/nickel transport system permease protein